MSDFTDSEKIKNEIEILNNKKEELTNILNSSKSNILSQALNQELKNIKAKLNILKNKNPNKFIDVYDNLNTIDKGDSYLSKQNSDYDLSQVKNFEPNKLDIIRSNIKKEKEEKEMKMVEPINVDNNRKNKARKINQENKDILTDDTNLIKIYNKFVKKNDNTSESYNFKTQSLLNCKEIISIVKLLEKQDKNNVLISRLKHSTRKLAKSIDKQFN